MIWKDHLPNLTIPVIQKPNKSFLHTKFSHSASVSQEWFSWADDPSISSILDTVMNMKDMESTKPKTKIRISSVASSIQKPVGFCLWYYYSHCYDMVAAWKCLANRELNKEQLLFLTTNESPDESRIVEKKSSHDR